jgi:hypothetical protein
MRIFLKDSATSLKAFTNFENPLRKAFSGVQVGTYSMVYTGENGPMTEKQSQNFNKAA